MKTIVMASVLSLGLVTGIGVQTVAAESLNALNSACRTGDFDACSQYNAAIIARQSDQNPTLLQGYDPFAIVPATHSTRTPTQPEVNAADIAVGKSGPDHQNRKQTQ